MHRNKHFTHINISGDDYLLPTAQSISDHKRGIRISETGALIWSLLEPGKSCSALIDDFITKAGISDTCKDDAASDVKLFLDHLIKLGIVYEDEDRSSDPGTPQSAAGNVVNAGAPYSEPVLELDIAGISIDLYGKKEYFAPSFESFIRTGDILKNSSDNKASNLTKGKADLRIAVIESPNDTACIIPDDENSGAAACTEPGDISRSKDSSGIIIRNKEMNISETCKEYVISYPESFQVIETRIDKGSFDTVIFIKKDHTGTDMYDPDSFVYQLFHAIRMPFLYAAGQKGLYAIHSVSILYREKAWLFSASSGTGKSTHAALWTDTSIASNINGDLNLIGSDNGTATVYGIPWCGTSAIYDTHSYPLGGVIFLKRSPVDRLEDISGSERVVTLTRRSISPVWNSMALQKMITDLVPIADSVYIKRLCCTKEPSAQKLLQASIDSYLCK